MAPPCSKGRIADIKYGLDQENLLLCLQYWACNAGGLSKFKAAFLVFFAFPTQCYLPMSLKLPISRLVCSPVIPSAVILSFNMFSGFYTLISSQQPLIGGQCHISSSVECHTCVIIELCMRPFHICEPSHLTLCALTAVYGRMCTVMLANMPTEFSLCIPPLPRLPRFRLAVLMESHVSINVQGEPFLGPSMLKRTHSLVIFWEHCVFYN